MEDVSFKPAGVALAAVVAGLAAAPAAAEAPDAKLAAAAAEAEASKALADAIAAFEPAEPFEEMVIDAPVSDVPLGA